MFKTICKIGDVTITRCTHPEASFGFGRSRSFMARWAFQVGRVYIIRGWF